MEWWFALAVLGQVWWWYPKSTKLESVKWKSLFSVLGVLGSILTVHGMFCVYLLYKHWKNCNIMVGLMKVVTLLVLVFGVECVGMGGVYGGGSNK